MKKQGETSGKTNIGRQMWLNNERETFAKIRGKYIKYVLDCGRPIGRGKTASVGVITPGDMITP